MVKDARIAWAHFDGANPACRRNGHREDEIPKNLLTVGGKLVRLSHAQHQVGSAKLPLIAELGRLRRTGGGPERLALFYPILNELDLRVAQTPLLCEIAVP